jgi:hypothetical protein
MKLTTNALTISLLVTGARLAQAQPPSPPSKPPAEDASLAYFLGQWKCEGTASPAPGKSVKLKATAKTKSEQGGFWQTFVYTEEKTSDYPFAVTAVGFWGWDAQAKKFVRSEYQSHGGYATGTSSGWVGDTLTWDVEESNFLGRISGKHSFTKKSDKEFVHKLEAKLPGAPGPVTIFEATCKK